MSTPTFSYIPSWVGCIYIVKTYPYSQFAGAVLTDIVTDMRAYPSPFGGGSPLTVQSSICWIMKEYGLTVLNQTNQALASINVGYTDDGLANLTGSQTFSVAAGASGSLLIKTPVSNLAMLAKWQVLITMAAAPTSGQLVCYHHLGAF